MKALLFLFSISLYAGNLSTLIGSGGGSGSSSSESPLVNGTYLMNGGANGDSATAVFFCRKKIITADGMVTHQYINDTDLCDKSGNLYCNDGACTGDGTGSNLYIYASTNTYYGNFNSTDTLRNKADAICRNEKPTELNCGRVRALISTSASDEIRDMPTNYGYGTSIPVMAYNKNTKVTTALGSNFADILDGTIDTSFGGATGYGANYFWTFSTSDGALSSHNCSSGGSSSSGFNGYSGRGNYSNGAWLGYTYRSCNNPSYIKCICQD